MSFRSRSWVLGSNVYYVAHIGWIHSGRDRVPPPDRRRRLGRAAALGCCVGALVAWSGFAPATSCRLAIEPVGSFGEARTALGRLPVGDRALLQVR